MSLCARLADVHRAIQSFDAPLPQLPVIAHDGDDRAALPGLRFLREEVRRECDVLDRLPLAHASSAAPSTNAPYLIAVWDELVHARRPVALYRTFSPANGWAKATGNGRTPARPVKVDVVAENGARWVRVNTIKNARLMMELREIDSYLTSDDDDELRPCLAQTEFDNSVLRMGRELLAAARANPVSVPTPFSSLVPNLNSAASNPSATMAPQVTIRLTRLDPSLKDDPRIEKTVQCLRDMGIDVQLGERTYPYPTPVPKIPLKLREPTTDVNLDLSALIALISDISHSSLPRTEQEAYARFEPPQSYLDWKKDRAKSPTRQSTHRSLYDVADGEDDEGIWENSGQHSRALAAQAIQEINSGLLKEIHERVSAVVARPSTPLTTVTFWTTREARHRCLQIVSKIGGKKERQRADALLGSTCCSRIPPVPAPAPVHLDGDGDGAARTGGMSDGTSGMDNAERNALANAYWEHSRYPPGFLPLVPVRVYPSILPGVVAEARQSRATFFDALMQTCTGILPHVSAPPDLLLPDEEILEEILPAMQTSVPKLTVHTVTSMLAGASRGYTTLTTNKSSVKAVLKEMRRVWGRGGYEPEMGDAEKAAMWVVDPRSLSEGMRSE